MKKFVIMLLAAAMLLTLCACAGAPAAQNTEEPAAEPVSEETPEPAFAGMPNPMTEYDTIEEVNNILGGKLCRPGVMGVEETGCYVINCGDFQIGQYNFTVNGMEYCFRFSPVVDRDISGVYVGEGTAFSDAFSPETEYASTSDEKLSRWFNLDGQYILNVKDNGSMEQETFESITEEMIYMTTPGMNGDELAAYYAGLAGSYADSYSQRAMMEVEAGTDSIKIVVHWANSAAEFVRWTMNASRAEDGLLYYTDCLCETVSTDENGVESVTEEYSGGSGYFGENEGVLFWNGAEDESCRECRFEKMP